jgi:HTH-type transcriptional regulator / antitoxin HigA
MQNIIENYPKIIKSEEQYQSSLRELDFIFNAKPGTPEGDRFELLSVLIDLYEQKHDPIEAPDPIEAILFLMDQKGMTISDLGLILGYKSRASEILSRKRKLTLPMMRRLHEKLGISPRVLISAY